MKDKHYLLEISRGAALERPDHQAVRRASLEDVGKFVTTGT
jgi:hypothetical protein